MSTTLIIVASATPATLLGALVVLMPALRMRSRAAIELVAADAAVAKAEELLTEQERTRNLPWYWPTGPVPAAELPVEEHPVGEVLAVAFPTQELRLVDGLARLADEVGLVQALSDRPAEDDDEVGDEQPGEAVSSVPSRLKAWASDLVDRAHDWLPGLLRQRAERDKVGSGEQATSGDPFAELLTHATTDRTAGTREVLAAAGIELDPDDEALVELEAWVKANPPTNHGPDGQRHWNNVTAMHEVVTPGRHSIPAQRKGDADV